MKKILAIVLCLALAVSLVACGNNEKQHNATIQIGEAIYCNTGDEVPVEPDERAIVDTHPLEGDQIKAYAIINSGDVDEMVVGLIDGEWYKFLPKE